MSDISASFILSHIRHYDIEKHKYLQNLYIKKLNNRFEVFNYNSEVIYGNFPIVFKDEMHKEQFRLQGIEVNKYYRPLKDTHYASDLFKRIINFPLHDQMTEKNIQYIVDKIL